MICKRCFRMSDDGFEYCPYCGQPFSDEPKPENTEKEHDAVSAEADEGDKARENREAIPKEGDRDDRRAGSPENGYGGTDPLHRPDGVPQGWNTPYGYTMPPPQYPYYNYPPREKSPAQKFFSAIGHAALYFMLFLLCQAIVAGVYSAVTGFRVTSEIMGDYIDDPYMTDEQYNEIMERAEKALAEALNGTALNIINILSALLTMLAVFLVSVAKHRPFSAHVGLYPLHSWLALLLIPIGISGQFLVNMIINIIPWPESVVESFNELYSYMGRGDGVFDIVIEILSVVIFAPLVEEMIFRGCVYTRLRRGMPIAVAMILSAVVFGTAHGALIAVFYASLLALLLAGMYEKFGTILAPFLVHLGFNLANYIPLMREDSSQAEIIVTLVLSAVVFVVCLSVIIVSNVGKRDHSADNETIPPIPHM